jgi:AmmeMemoRadiSam system protein A
MTEHEKRGGSIDADGRAQLLALARRALEAHVRGEAPPQPPRGGVFGVPCAAFVSIHRRGELRGCLGRLDPRPLSDTIVHLAAVVSDADPRFNPVRPDELGDLEIEISVLTSEREVASIDEIEVGRHGLIVEKGYRRGLLLPQVPVEQGWTRTVFLEHTCLKAGLPRDAWEQGARLKIFEAEVFGEGEAPQV